MVWIDSAFPTVLGAELYRPHPGYIAEMAFEPTVIHDFSKQPGDTVQLDRYDFWGDPGTKESRERNMTQILGTANTRDISKSSISVELKEYTGPGSLVNPNDPACFKIPLQKALFAQRLLWQGRLNQFHQSIGSITLLDDYRRWRDRVYIYEALKTTNVYNPRGVADGGSYTGLTEAPKFDVTQDLLTVVEGLRTRNVPTFSDGNYRALVSPRFMKHLRANSDFREVARYPGFGGEFSPNQLIFGGPQHGQANFVNMQPTMPTGVVFEGVRFFETTNLITQTVNLNYAYASGVTAPPAHPAGAADRTAHLGMFFGPQAVGTAIGGPNAEVLLNNNDDYARFVIAIWRLYAGFELLNPDFITVARTYGD